MLMKGKVMLMKGKVMFMDRMKATIMKIVIKGIIKLQTCNIRMCSNQQN